MKTVLVTGGSSFIGKHCIAELIKSNYKVRTTIRDINRSDEIKLEIEKFLKKKLILDFYKKYLNKYERLNY